MLTLMPETANYRDQLAQLQSDLDRHFQRANELQERVEKAVAYTHRNGHSGVNVTTQEHLAAVRKILEGQG